MRQKHLFLIIVLFLILSVIFHKNILPFRKDSLLLSDSRFDDFYYRYVDIYKKFFVPVKEKGEVVYSPQRIRCNSKSFLLHKEKGVKRIFVIGGSVAQMFNHDSQLQNLLHNLFLGENFEVIGCGMGAYDSYRETLVLNEAVSYSPDLIILMSGNNEFISPVSLNLFAYRCNKFLGQFRFYRLLQQRIIGQSNDFQFSPKNRLINFENNLKKMIRIAKKKRIPMAICTLPANFRDCPPAGSQPLEEKTYFQAWFSSSRGNFKEAAQGFRQFLQNYPQDAFGNYFLAQSYDKLGNYSQAKDYYLKALAYSDPMDRCSPQCNAVIRKLCGKYDLILIDLEKTFMDASSNKLAGNDLFIDNCHWWQENNFLVYQAIAQSMLGYNRTHPKPLFALPVFEEKKRSLSGDLNDANEDLAEKSFRKLMYGFSNLLYNRFETIDERAVAFLRAAFLLNQDSFRDKDLLKKEVFRRLSDSPWAETYASDFNNVWPVFLYHLGETYRRLGLYEKAIEYFNEAINASKSDFWPPFLGRSMVYYETKKIKEAKEDFCKVKEKSKDCPWLEFYRELLMMDR